jgi:tetratricopeptide (TPR) repeat protein
MQTGHNDRAALAFTQALELSPDDAQLRVLRGRAYLACKAWDLAAADFDRALDLKRSAAAYLGRALARLQLNRPREAAADAEEAGRRAGGDWRQAYGAACLLAQASAQTDSARLSDSARRERQRQQEFAVNLLEKAVEAHPADGRAAFWRDTVQAEPALRPLRSRAGFAELDRRYTPRRP